MRKQVVNAVGCLVVSFGLVCSLAAPAGAITRYEVDIATSGSLVGMDRKELVKRLQDIKAMGVTWLRVDFNWPAIQPKGPHHYQWGPYDYLVNQSLAQRLKILVVLNNTPAWAQDPQCRALAASDRTAQKCNPRNSQEFGAFAGAVAKRYKGKNLRGWEIWNEPNLTGHWRSVRTDRRVTVDPTKYAAIANTAAAQIRKHNADCVILSGGLAPMFEPSPMRGMRQSDYLAKLLPQLKSELFTGVAVHPYSWPALPSKRAVYNAFYTVDNDKPKYNLRAVMQAAGWGNKEIWGTEYGASTSGQRGANHPIKLGRPDHVTEDAQAKIVSDGIRQWYKKKNVGPLFVHSDSDKWLANRKNEKGFGLRRSNGVKKPAYYAFEGAVKEINGKHEWRVRRSAQVRQ